MFKNEILLFRMNFVLKVLESIIYLLEININYDLSRHLKSGYYPGVHKGNTLIAEGSASIFFWSNCIYKGT